MEVKFTQAQMEEIFAEVKAAMVAEGLRMAKQELSLYMRNGEFIGQVRNIVAKETAQELKHAALKKIRESEVIERALKAAEQRINHEIHVRLMKGINVSIDLGNSALAKGEQQ